jgi:hypothetical protein
MKIVLHGLGLGIIGLSLTGLVGCTDTNEKEVLRDTNAGGKKAIVDEAAPKTQEEMYQMQMKQGGGTAKGYGGRGGGQRGGRR